MPAGTTIQLKRHVSGVLDTSTVLANGELLYDEIDSPRKLYIGDGTKTIAQLESAHEYFQFLKDGAIGTSQLDTSAVTSDKIATSAVITAKIADGAVTTDKIGASAVTTAKINNGAVTTDKIGASAVTTAKIADDSVSLDKLDVTVPTGVTTIDEYVDSRISAAGAGEATKLYVTDISNNILFQAERTSSSDPHIKPDTTVVIGGFVATANTLSGNADSAISVAHMDCADIRGNFGEGTYIGEGEISGCTIDGCSLTNCSINASDILGPSSSSSSYGILTGAVNSSASWIDADSVSVGYASEAGTATSADYATSAGYANYANGMEDNTGTYYFAIDPATNYVMALQA